MKSWVLLAAVLISLPAKAVTLQLKLGTDGDGSAHPDWVEVINNNNHSNINTKKLIEMDKPFTSQEMNWINLIKDRMVNFINNIDELNQALKKSKKDPPNDIAILVGNRGGPEGKLCRSNTICLDLSEWTKNHGSSSSPGNAEKIDKVFNREYKLLLKNIARR